MTTSWPGQLGKLATITTATAPTLGKHNSYATPSRTDTVTITLNSSTVQDTAIQAGDAGRPVSGDGIPFNSFVGVVVAGVSFTIVNSSGTTVPAVWSSTSATLSTPIAPTLPPLTTGAVATALAAGQLVRVKVSKSKTDTTGQSVTLTAAAGDTFESGATTVPLLVPGERITLTAGTVPGGSGPVWIAEEHTVPRDSIDQRYVSLTGIGGAAQNWSVAPKLRSAGNGFALMLKDPADTQQGAWDLLVSHNTGYGIHFQTRQPGKAPAYVIAMGLDVDYDASNLGIGGILLANKTGARALTINQYATITHADAYGINVLNSSTVAPAVRLEQNATNGAPLLQLFSALTTSDTGRLLEISAGGSNSTIIGAATGDIDHRRNLLVQDSGSATNYVEVATNGSTADNQRNRTRLRKDSLTFYNWSGTAGTWFPLAIVGTGNHMRIQTAGSTTDLTAVPSTTMLDVQHNKLGFFAAAPVVQPTGTPVAATDAATTQALVNSIRASLIGLGLIA